MRVAHIITRMIVGGAQENTLLNCLDLVRIHGDDVLLVTGPALGPEGDLLGQGGAEDLPVRIVPQLRRAIHPGRDWSSYWALRSILREFRPDVVHTHSAKGGFLGRLAAWDERVPAIVHTVHGAPFHPYQGRGARTVFRACEKYAARRCHALVSVADAMTDLLVEAGVAPREKFTTVYSGMDIEPFLAADEQRSETRRALGYDERHVVIGKIARLFHLKGHEYVVAAAEQVVRQCADARFLLVGDGLLRAQLEKQIAAAGLGGYFQFTGLVEPARIPQLIGAMDMLVHASLREGLARALPQALIAGRPVVSYDVDGAREVVVTGQTGYLLPPKSIEPMAAALVELARDAALRRRLGEAGRARLAEQFRHQFMTARLRLLYEDILNRARNRDTNPTKREPATPQ